MSNILMGKDASLPIGSLLAINTGSSHFGRTVIGETAVRTIAFPWHPAHATGRCVAILGLAVGLILSGCGGGGGSGEESVAAQDVPSQTSPTGFEDSVAPHLKSRITQIHSPFESSIPGADIS